MKRYFWVAALVLVASGLPAQQFFKTGVVDITRVYTQFYKETKPVRDFDELKAGIQKEIDKMKEDIRLVNDQRNDAKAKSDAARVQTLDADILKRTDAMKEYARVQQLVLNQKNEELKADGSFQKLLTSEIEQAALSKGFGLVLNLKDTSIVWYGPDTDITDDVIARLTADFSR
ncbi:MAG: OmpH family outer membrane protein [Spirochaetales bacterium]